MSDIPENLQYSEDHEWVDASASPARIGITDYATEQLGDIVYLDLPEVDSEVTAGSKAGEIESTKSVSDFIAPVSGTVVAVNDAASEDPAVVNDDPYGEGWLIKVDVSDEGSLLSPDEYAKIAGEDSGDSDQADDGSSES